MHKEKFKSYYQCSLVIVLFMLHPNLSNACFEAFAFIILVIYSFQSCREIGDGGKYYLRADLEVECYSSTHITNALIYAVPGLIFYVIVIIHFALFILLFRVFQHQPFEFYDKQVKQKFGFLYVGFRRQTYLWEFVVLYRKIAVICCSVFMATLGSKIQGIFVLGVSGVCYLLQKWIEPYYDDCLNELEKRSLIASTFTLYASIFFISGFLQIITFIRFYYIDQLSTGLILAIAICIFALNLWFLLLWVKEMVRQKIKELQRIKIIDALFGRILQQVADLPKFKYPEQVETEEELTNLKKKKVKKPIQQMEEKSETNRLNSQEDELIRVSDICDQDQELLYQEQDKIEILQKTNDDQQNN